MATFIFDKERDMMVEKDTGLPMLNQAERARPLQRPRVFGDLPGYQSPIDGSWIEGRRARKYDLEKNNCVDANDFSTPRKLKNERFAEKRGLKHLLE
jgi:hypothetical protein